MDTLIVSWAIAEEPHRYEAWNLLDDRHVSEKFTQTLSAAVSNLSLWAYHQSFARNSELDLWVQNTVVIVFKK